MPQVPSYWTCLVAQRVKHLPSMPETRVQCLGREDLLVKEMATCSSVLAWKIQWMEEPGRLWSMGSQRAGHDRAISLSFSLLPLPQRETGFRIRTQSTAQCSLQIIFSFFLLSISSVHEPQHTRPACPSSTPGVHTNPCPLSQ